MAEIYEIEHEGEIWEVEANSIDEAVAAFAPKKVPARREIPDTPAPPPDREATDERSWYQKAVEGTLGGAIAAGSIAGQSAGEVAAGISGLLTLGGSAMIGHKDPMGAANTAIETIRQGTQKLFGLDTAAPKRDMIVADEQTGIVEGGFASLQNATEDARNGFRAVGEALNTFLGTGAGKAVVDFARTADDANLKVFGPGMGALVKATVLGIPEIVGRPSAGLVHAGAKAGLRGGLIDTAVNPKVALRRHKYNREFEKAMEDAAAEVEKLGIKLDMDEFAPSVADAANKMPSSTVTRGQGLKEVETGVQEAAKKSREIGDKLYEIARAKKAKVDVGGLPALADNLRRQLWDEGVPNINEGAIAASLDELENIGKLFNIETGGAKVTHVSFNAMDTLRKRIKNRINPNDASTARALGVIKRQLDDYMDNTIAAGLIKGDKSAAQAWKTARMHTARSKAKFKDDKLIRDLIANDATEKQLLGALLGISDAGMHKNAASIYRRLQDILGKDHPGLLNMRTSVIGDLYAPLTRSDSPAFSLFVRKLDKFKRENKELIEAMDIDMEELETMARAAKAANAVKGVSKGSKVDKTFVARSLGRLIFGHQIAQAGVRVNLANLFIEQVMGAHKMTDQAMLRYLAGVDEKMASSKFLPPDHPKMFDVMVFGAAADARTNDDKED